MGYAKMKSESVEKANDPRPGDYWSDCLTPVCVVVERFGNNVVICKTTMEVDDDHWTWDLTKLEILTVDEFKQSLTYETNDRLWAECSANHSWVTEQARQM